MMKQKSSKSPPKISLVSPPKTSESKRSHVIRLQRVPAPKTPLSPMPLQEGIRMLEDFGFRTQASAAAVPRLSVLAEFTQKPAKPLVHVTDFWSQRQQQEFLVRTGLKQAQYERERKERKEAFLGSKEKIEGVHINDQLYERLVAEDDPVEAAKAYAAGPQGRLLKQLRNQVSQNSPTLSIRK